jgi:hypothetical protein
MEVREVCCPSAGGGGASGSATLTSGQVQSGHIGNNAVTSGNIASGSVGWPKLASGAVRSGHIGDGAVVSGSIASGQVGQDHLASGIKLDIAELLVDDNFTAAERISGGKAVGFNSSGNVQIAMAALPVRMPAVGVAIDNIESGQPVPIYHKGRVSSPEFNLSGGIGQAIFVGNSGELQVVHPSLSGSIIQPIGEGASQSGLFVGAVPASGEINQLRVGPESVRSGHVASGAVKGSLGGGFATVASGTVGPDDLGSGSVRSGHVASGQVSTFKMASGAINSGHVGSGAVVGAGIPGAGRSIASGSVAGPDLASGAVQSGHIGDTTVVSGSLASGQVGQFKLSSGAVNSGHVASGAVLGSRGGGAFTIASGTVGGDDLGSGAVLSGHLASGQVSSFKMASGAIRSGHVGDTAVVSGSFASGSISNFKLASGSINSGHVGSGSVVGAGIPGAGRSVASGSIFGPDLASGAAVSGHLGDASVNSGTIASGVVGTPHMASGTQIDIAELLIDDNFITSETVSGGRAVAYDASGAIHIAMAALPDRMPAVGVVVDNILSGQVVRVYHKGRVYSTQLNVSGALGLPVFVGNSGELQAVQPALSGSIVQAIGEGITASGVMVGHVPASGDINRLRLASGQVTSGHLADTSVTSGSLASGSVASPKLASGAAISGHIGSGAVLGERGGGARTIASGTVGPNDLASGAALSGHIGSGAIQGSLGGGAFNVASGTVGPSDLGSGSVLSGHIASGQLSNFKMASGSINSGHVGSGAVLGELAGGARTIASGSVGPNDLGSGAVLSGAVASGQIGSFHLGSGSVRSGHLASGNVSNFKMASGAINSGHVGSGAVLGERGGGAFTIASGTVGPNDLASGAALSGHLGSGSVLGERGGGARTIASGTVGPNDLASGAALSGHIGSGAIQGSRGGGAFNIASGTVGGNDLASGAVLSGHIASGQIGQFKLSSGAVNSGHVGNAAVVSGSIASGQIDTHHIASGTIVTHAKGQITPNLVLTEETVSGAVAVTLSQSGLLRVAMASVSGRMPAIGVLASGALSGQQAAFMVLGPFQFASGLADYSGYLGQPLVVGRSGQVVTASGSWNSGGLQPGDVWQQIGAPHNSGGAFVEVNPRGITVGGTMTIAPGPGGIALAAAAGGLTSGAVQSGHIASGAVQGFYGATRHIASGTVGSFDLAPGGVESGAYASGSISDFKFASGATIDYSLTSIFTGQTAELISGGPAVAFVSGFLRTAWPRAGSTFYVHPAIGVVTDNIDSGLVARFYHKGPVFSDKWNFAGAEGNPVYVGQSGTLITTPDATVIRQAIGQVISASGIFLYGGGLGSGNVNSEHLGSGAVLSGAIASGQIGTNHISSGSRISFAENLSFDDAETTELISGIKAVAFASGGFPKIALAERASGFLLPAIGVTRSGAASGQTCVVVRYGRVLSSASGMIASGFHGFALYVGSGGLLVNRSGFMGGASSGAPFFSGNMQQIIGYAVSGGVFVDPGVVGRSGFAHTLPFLL